MFYKTLILIALLSLDFIFLSGQSIHYDYDESGNRIKRYIVLGKGNSSEEKTSKEIEETSKPEEFEDRLGELTIKIYPNPTQGKLLVEINGMVPEETIDYQIFSQTGILLDVKKKIGQQFTVDLDRYPSGIYILRLMVNEKISQWKIFKK